MRPGSHKGLHSENIGCVDYLVYCFSLSVTFSYLFDLLPAQEPYDTLIVVEVWMDIDKEEMSQNETNGWFRFLVQ